MKHNKIPKLIFLYSLFLFLLCGCLTDVGYLIKDHTLGIVSSPVSAPGMLLWRLKTFTGETLGRIKVRFFNFPVLETIPVPDILPEREMMSENYMSSWLDKKYGTAVSGDLKLLIGGEKFFTRLEEVIRDAEKSIDIHTYIFDNDDVSIYFADLLKEKSQSVKVRILLDWFASRNSWKIAPSNEENVFQPIVPNMIRYLKKDSNIKVNRTNNLWFSSDHSKMILIDEKLIFFGGMNFGREYRYEWRDMMIEVKGPLVEVFYKSFHKARRRTRLFEDFLYVFDKYKRKKLAKKKGNVKCHILLTTPFRFQIYKAQLKAARNAKHHIYIENSYIWNHKFLYALCEARKRGVDVRVTMPGKLDVPLWQGATKLVLNTLLQHGVRVFLYPGMTHVKAAVYDNWACFGSANFDDLSLHKNFEINLSTHNAEFVKKIEDRLLINGQKLSSERTELIDVDFFDTLAWGMKDYV